MPLLVSVLSATSRSLLMMIDSVECGCTVKLYCIPMEEVMDTFTGSGCTEVMCSLGIWRVRKLPFLGKAT